MKQAFEFTKSILVMALVLAGIAGLSYHAFKEDGFVEETLGDIWEWQFQYPLIAIPLTVGAIILFKTWASGNMFSRKSGLADILVYILMALGAYFIGNYFMHGTV